MVTKTWLELLDSGKLERGKSNGFGVMEMSVLRLSLALSHLKLESVIRNKLFDWIMLFNKCYSYHSSF